jgi:hypothetical protein
MPPPEAREVVIMSTYTRASVSGILWLFFVAGCGHATEAQTPLKTITTPQGGTIVYGQVAGATSQAAAMGFVLRSVHNDCGERPQVGNIFQVRGTNSVAVFFTVVNRTHGNKPVAGMVIAAQTGSNQFESGLVSDSTVRFSQTINPMLQQLFSVWHPGATTNPPSSTGKGVPSAVALRKVTLPDSTASVGIPQGWSVDPKSGGGGILLRGPQGEVVVLNSWFLAQDPNGLGYRNAQRMGMKPLQGMVIFPANADLVKNFAQIIKLVSQAKGFTPAGLKIDYSEQVSPPVGSSFEGERCALATGQINPDGKGMQAMFRVICANPPDQYGDYHFADYVAYFPHTETSQANAIASAIFASFCVDEALVSQRASAEAAPHIAQLKQVDAQQRQAVQARNAQIIGNIQQIGANATARMNATQAANDAQHASYWAQQDSNARNSQGFSNYLLDQSVVQNNATGAHGTLWNNTANALVQANPNRYTIVQTPNFWKGIDY